jgi:hypothetical protein
MCTGFRKNPKKTLKPKTQVAWSGVIVLQVGTLMGQNHNA